MRSRGVSVTARSRLSEEQERAAALLAEGKMSAEVTKEVGTDAATIETWWEDAHFVAAVNRKRKEAWWAARDRLRALVSKAVDALERALDEGDVRAATEVLKAAGVYGKVEAPSGEVDPELVMVRQAESWAATELAKEGPARDVLAPLLDDGRRAELAQKRLRELRGTGSGRS